MLSSATVLKFGGAHTFFVADSDAGRIYAFQLPETKPQEKSEPFNIIGFGEKVAELYSVDRGALVFHDIAIHPHTKEAY